MNDPKQQAGTHGSVAVIGAGLTGLSASLFLEKQGVAVDLFEQQQRCGGVITTRQNEGFLYELGPSTLQRGNQALETVLRDTGLDAEVQTTAPVARYRYIVRNGKITALPHSPLAFLSSRWLSLRGKLRLLKEPFVPKASASTREQESVADFTRRRLGQEVYDYGIDPFVSGIHAGDPEQLSLRLAFPRLFQAEDLGGSLFRGFPKLAKQSSVPRKSRPKGIFSFAKGLQTLPDRMLKSFQGNFYPGSSVVSIVRDASGWKLGWQHSESAEIQYRTYSAIVIASWNPELKKILPETAPTWPNIDYSPVQVISVGFPRDAVAHPLDGFGVLAPSKEKQPFLGAIFSSSIFPDRTPAGQVLLNVFLGGKRHSDAIPVTQQEFTSRILPSLALLLGIRGLPSFFDTQIWQPGIPQYTHAHQQFLDARQQFEETHPGLLLAGNSVDGISMPNCIESGQLAAEKIRMYLFR